MQVTAIPGKGAGGMARIFFERGYNRIHVRWYCKFAQDFDQGNLMHLNKLIYVSMCQWDAVRFLSWFESSCRERGSDPKCGKGDRMPWGSIVNTWYMKPCRIYGFAKKVFTLSSRRWSRGVSKPAVYHGFEVEFGG